MCRNLYIVIILFFASVSYGTVTEQLSLPFDETEAEYMIKTGELDSSFWEELKPYYVEKISVPHGELFILRNIIPQLPQEIPVDIDKLEKYVPWDEKRIELFFSDYPYLQPYRQILDFSYAVLKQSGKIGFSYYKSELSNKSRQSSQVLINPVPQIKFQSRIDFTTEFARWQCRSLKLKPTDWITLEFGNFNNSFDQGLIYGYFPYRVNSSVKDNWLYGKTSSWNGLCITAGEFEISSGLSVNAFFHKRYSETASGFDSKINFSKKNWFQAGLNKLSTNNSGDDLVYFYCGSGISVSKFKSQILAAFELSRPEEVSFICKNRIISDMLSHSIEFVYIPKGYFAPRSRLVKSGFGKNYCLRPLSSSLMLAGIESQYKIKKSRISLGLRTDICDIMLNKLNCFLKINLADFKIEYKWKNFGNFMDSTNHYLNCAYHFRLNRCISFETEHHFAIKYEDHLFYHGSVGTELVLPVRMNIKPFFKIANDKSMEMEKKVGIKHVFAPFERIYTELVIEKSSLFSSWELMNGYVEVRAWFLF